MSTAALIIPYEQKTGQTLGVGDDFNMILKQQLEATEHYRWPTTRQPQSIEREFQELANAWRQETQFTSSTTEMVMNRSYQRIIGLGPDVIPCILRELDTRPDHWFWALTALTGADPVSHEQRGRVKDMAKVWLCWGREAGYTW